MEFDKIIEQIQLELEEAVSKFGPFHNAHHGYAVILEEVEELWANVKLKQSNPDRPRLLAEEAIQVAAMAIRLIQDCGELD